MFTPPPIQVLLPSVKQNGDDIVCSQSDFQKILYLALAFIVVDEEWYCEQYPDVDSAIKAKKIDSASEHYRKAGYREGRFPFKPDVDEQWYLKQYPDVRRAIQSGQFNDATEHFVTSGYSEGRTPRPVPVDQEWYRRTYPGASARIDKGQSKDATEDFLEFGYRDGLFPFRPLFLNNRTA